MWSVADYTNIDIFRQYAALSVSLVSFVEKNLCVRSLGYIVGASPPCENMCVRSLGYIVGASPPLCENMCVCSLGYIVGASPPLCVCSIANTCMLPTPLCGIFC